MPARTLTTRWAAATLATAVVLVLALLPPFLNSAAAQAVETGFAWLCHQLPGRTLHLANEPVALCHRCLGMLTGLVAGLALAPVAPQVVAQWVDARLQARVLAAAVVPVAVDWALGALSVWTNTPASRALTGAVFGAAAGAMIGLALLAASRDRNGDASEACPKMARRLA